MPAGSLQVMTWSALPTVSDTVLLAVLKFAVAAAFTVSVCVPAPRTVPAAGV